MKKIGILVGAVAVLAIMSQSAQAGDWPWSVKDKRLAGTAFVVGAGATAAYFGTRHNSTLGSGGAYALTSVGCAAVTPIVGTIVLKRELTKREGHVVIANCFLPFVGGWIVNAAYDAHPEWEKPAKKKR